MFRQSFLGISLSSLLWAGSAAGVRWTDPAGWRSQGERPMRAATYSVPAAAGDKEDAECAVFYFGAGQGGGIDANIQRWLGQFENKPAAPPKPKVETINGHKVTTIEHSGTYLAGAPMSPQKTPKPGYHMVGSIVETPQGNIFFKLTGPAKTVAAAKPAFLKMLQSIQK